MSCCMCEPTETASLGDDTHAAVQRPKRVSGHGLQSKCGIFCFSGFRKSSIDGA